MIDLKIGYAPIDDVSDVSTESIMRFKGKMLLSVA